MELIKITLKIFIMAYGLFIGVCLGIAIISNLRKGKKDE